MERLVGGLGTRQLDRPGRDQGDSAADRRSVDLDRAGRVVDADGQRLAADIPEALHAVRGVVEVRSPDLDGDLATRGVVGQVVGDRDGLDRRLDRGDVVRPLTRDRGHVLGRSDDRLRLGARDLHLAVRMDATGDRAAAPGPLEGLRGGRAVGPDRDRLGDGDLAEIDRVAAAVIVGQRHGHVIAAGGRVDVRAEERTPARPLGGDRHGLDGGPVAPVEPGGMGVQPARIGERRVHERDTSGEGRADLRVDHGVEVRDDDRDLVGVGEAGRVGHGELEGVARVVGRDERRRRRRRGREEDRRAVDVDQPPLVGECIGAVAGMGDGQVEQDRRVAGRRAREARGDPQVAAVGEASDLVAGGDRDLRAEVDAICRGGNGDGERGVARELGRPVQERPGRVGRTGVVDDRPGAVVGGAGQGRTRHVGVVVGTGAGAEAHGQVDRVGRRVDPRCRAGAQVRRPDFPGGVHSHARGLDTDRDDGLDHAVEVAQPGDGVAARVGDPDVAVRGHRDTAVVAAPGRAVTS